MQNCITKYKSACSGSLCVTLKQPSSPSQSICWEPSVIWFLRSARWCTPESCPGPTAFCLPLVSCESHEDVSLADGGAGSSCPGACRGRWVAPQGTPPAYAIYTWAKRWDWWLDHTCDGKILPRRTVYSGTLLHILPMLVWFVGSSLSLIKSHSRPLFWSLKMEHKFETKMLSEFQVPAVTKEGRKSMMPVAKHETSKGNKSGSKAQKRSLQGFPMPLVIIVFI